MSKTFPDDLTAADVMTAHIVTVNGSATLREVMAVLVENHVSGAPVVDAKGKCIGVVSATDILGFEEDHSEAADEANEDVAQFFDADSQRWESVRLSAFALEELADVSVQEVMSTEIVSVRRSTPVKQVAKKMMEQGVHRVVVIEDGLAVGIVSASDLVRAIAEKS